MHSPDCTLTKLRTPESPRSSSCVINPYSTLPMPAQPYPLSDAPKKPRSAMGLTSSRGKRPARLHSSMMGMRLSSINWRVVSRTSRSSSVRSESNWMKSTPRNLIAGMMNLHGGQTYDGSRGTGAGSTQTGRRRIVAQAFPASMRSSLVHSAEQPRAAVAIRRPSAFLIRERLKLRHAGVRTIYIARSEAGMQRDMHRDHVEGVREIKSVDSLVEVAVDAVHIDRAALRGRT